MEGGKRVVASLDPSWYELSDGGRVGVSQSLQGVRRSETGNLTSASLRPALHTGCRGRGGSVESASCSRQLYSHCHRAGGHVRPTEEAEAGGRSRALQNGAERAECIAMGVSVRLGHGWRRSGFAPGRSQSEPGGAKMEMWASRLAPASQ